MQKAAYRAGADSILDQVETLQEAEHVTDLPRGRRPALLVQIRPRCPNTQLIEEQPRGHLRHRCRVWRPRWDATMWSSIDYKPVCDMIHAHIVPHMCHNQRNESHVQMHAVVHQNFRPDYSSQFCSLGDHIRLFVH